MNEDAVYAAARRVINAGLAGDGSAFTPGGAVWTVEPADQLHIRFVQQPDAGRGSFVRKLQGQLAAASPTAVQLMGELIMSTATVDQLVRRRGRRIRRRGTSSPRS